MPQPTARFQTFTLTAALRGGPARKELDAMRPGSGVVRPFLTRAQNNNHVLVSP